MRDMLKQQGMEEAGNIHHKHSQRLFLMSDCIKRHILVYCCIMCYFRKEGLESGCLMGFGMYN